MHLKLLRASAQFYLPDIKPKDSHLPKRPKSYPCQRCVLSKGGSQNHHGHDILHGNRRHEERNHRHRSLHRDRRMGHLGHRNLRGLP